MLGVPVKFEIHTSIFTTKVNSEVSDYIFKSKLFSHSSRLIDEHSTVVACLSRTSWWRMDFDLFAGDKKYKLHQRALGTELVFSESNLRFHTLSGLEFFNKALPVTRVAINGNTANNYSLEVNEKDHWLALLMATCLECNLLVTGG